MTVISNVYHISSKTSYIEKDKKNVYLDAIYYDR